MVALKDSNSSYLSQFRSLQAELARDGWFWTRSLRQKAMERFSVLGFPTLKDEEWRFTNLAPLTRIAFEPGDQDNSEPAKSLLLPRDRQGTSLDFVDGHRAPIRHQGPALPDGVLVCPLGEAVGRHKDLVEPHLARHADYHDHAFTALNTAFFRDGAFVYVPPDTVVKEPIYLTFFTTSADRPRVWHRRCLVVVGSGSHASIVESHSGSGGVSFTNTVTEVVLAENAVLDYHLLQRESKEAFHVATVQVQQARGSRFTSTSVALGSALARTDLNVVLDGEGCESKLHGLYMGTGDQLIDNHTRIDHAMPRCSSQEIYKGILDGKARGVFNGIIYVHPDAQKTDARQTNKTLLLSDEAVIDTKPQLEIYADDVKCTHGASIGQLDEEQLFYLRTRGIDRAAARQVLTYAFANDVISRIQIEPLRTQLEQVLLAPEEAP